MRAAAGASALLLLHGCVYIDAVYARECTYVRIYAVCGGVSTQRS